MSTARDILLDNTGDLKIGGDPGDLSLVSGPDSIAQHAKIALRTFAGEWFADTSAGFPFYELVFVKGPNLPMIRARMRDTLLGLKGVLDVLSVSLSMDGKTRSASGSFQAETDQGMLDVAAFKIGS